ncbi:MAG: hypothetical protein HY918_00070 [Candidatus Doudnabacteria bacterium]|nr:hypothetical protein [Candidatus Doudnabacteria bacterium]
MEIKKTQDLGLGDKVVQQNRTRFLNRDGSFNVHRKGSFERGNFSPYHAILNMTWPRFLISVLGYYLSINLFFTFWYYITGSAAFPELSALSAGQRFGQLFFYSIQVITTLGSSPLHPASTMSHVGLAIEALVGLFGFAVGASLMFARFSNPSVKILFSKKAVIAPYENMTGLMVRIINGRSNELIEVKATVTLAMQNKEGRRTFQQLPLERDMVLVFPLNWTIVHPIDKDSPLYGMTAKDLADAHVEFLIGITAIDQDLSKTIYTRTSYLYKEVMVGYKFTSIIESTQDGTVVVDPKKISNMEKV